MFNETVIKRRNAPIQKFNQAISSAVSGVVSRHRAQSHTRFHQSLNSLLSGWLSLTFITPLDGKPTMIVGAG